MHRPGLVCIGIVLGLVSSQPGFAQAPGGRGQGGAPGRGPQGPAVATLAGDLQADLERTRELVVNLVEAMPEDKFGFKPTPEQQTFGERAMHIVQVDSFLFNTLGAKTPAPTIDMKATSKADILTALRQSYDWQMQVLEEFTDAQLVARVTPPAFLGSSASRARIFYYDYGHTQDTYGQLVVYLRLNGITPPASRRGGI